MLPDIKRFVKNSRFGASVVVERDKSRLGRTAQTFSSTIFRPLFSLSRTAILHYRDPFV